MIGNGASTRRPRVAHRTVAVGAVILAAMAVSSTPASGVTGGAPVRATTEAGRSSVDIVTSGSPAGWISTPDKRRRVSPLTSTELVPSTRPNAIRLVVDGSSRYQRMDGFGAALTESSAHLLMSLPRKVRTATLRALFDPRTGAGISLVRLPLGASDFALSHYTYDDIPAGQRDPSLTSFSLAHDDAAIIPVLQEAVQINPSLRVMGTPWSAPAWMKTSQSLIGGTLAAGNTDVYARYLVKTAQALRARGVPLRFLTLQNEPQFTPGDYPGMLMSPAQESQLAVALSAKLAEAGLGDIALIGYDHNWDSTSYALSLLSDQPARSVLAGTAWHCYAGGVDAQRVVHDLHPDKGIWFTECSGGNWATDFGSNLGWNASTLVIGATRAWARSVLLWNLALNPTGGPHTGGCSGCRGVLTIDPKTGTVTRNEEFDVLALAGRAVRPGAHRIASPAEQYGVKTVAYRNTDGTRVLTAYNSWATDQVLVVSEGTRRIGAPLPAGAVVTVTW